MPYVVPRTPQETRTRGAQACMGGAQRGRTHTRHKPGQTIKRVCVKSRFYKRKQAHVHTYAAVIAQHERLVREGDALLWYADGYSWMWPRACMRAH